MPIKFGANESRCDIVVKSSTKSGLKTLMIRVLFNKKGGVGKSSLAVNLAAISAANGHKTLLIDLDTQCNSTHYLDVPELDREQTIAGLFDQTITFHLRRKPAVEFAYDTPLENLSIIPGSAHLSDIESELHSRHKIYKLREALHGALTHYDRIYIDTPPALNFYSLSALIAANTVLIPIDCDDFAIQGLFKLQQHIAEIQEDHNEELSIEGIIANQYLSTAKLPNQIIQSLLDEGHPVIPTYVSQSVKMRESHQVKKPLLHMAPKHKLTLALVDIYRFLEEKNT